LYNIKVVNKTVDAQQISLQIISPDTGEISFVSNLNAPANGLCESAFFIELPAEAVIGSKTDVEIEVLMDGVPVETVKTTFLGP